MIEKIKILIDNLISTFFCGPINFENWSNAGTPIISWNRFYHRGYVWTPITIPRIRYKPWNKCLFNRFY